MFESIDYSGLKDFFGDYYAGFRENNFNQQVLDASRELSNRAYKAFKKRHGSVWLSNIDNQTFLSVLELWLGTSDNITIITLEEEVILTVSSQKRMWSLPIDPSGLRGMAEAFNLAAEGGPAVETTVETNPYPYIYTRPLLDGGTLTICSDFVPQRIEEKPVLPREIQITRPEIAYPSV